MYCNVLDFYVKCACLLKSSPLYGCFSTSLNSGVYPAESPRHMNTNITVVMQETEIKSLFPLCHFSLFQPPTAEVGGSVGTKYDRDSDPQRNEASHSVPDIER